MNIEDAGAVGKRLANALANAALIFAILTGSAAVLAAIAQFFK